MSYSPITRISVENFMSFSKASAEFQDRGILTLKGFNDSGKSAFLLAVAILTQNSFPMDQKNLIRDGEKFFKISMEFADATRIDRYKFANGQSLYEMFRGSQLVFTTRNGDDSLGKVESVPKVIADYLGLFSDGSGRSLHFRRKSDPLLLVDTSGRENFEMLNSILKTRELSDAARMASDTANNLQAEVNSLTNKLHSFDLALADIWATPELVESLSGLADQERSLHAQRSELVSMAADVDRLKGMPVPPKVGYIDTESVTALDEMLDLLDEFNSPVVPELSQVSGEVLIDLMEISGLLPDESVKTFDVPAVSGGGMLSALGVLVETSHKLKSLTEGIRDLEMTGASLHEKYSRIMSWGSRNGLNIVECPHCGSFHLAEEVVQ